jgi:hypothetical protein
MDPLLNVRETPEPYGAIYAGSLVVEDAATRQEPQRTRGKTTQAEPGSADRSEWLGALLQDIVETTSRHIRTRRTRAGSAKVPLAGALRNRRSPSSSGLRRAAIGFISSGARPWDRRCEGRVVGAWISDGLADELDGDVALEFGAAGVHCTIDVPIIETEAS